MESSFFFLLDGLFFFFHRSLDDDPTKYFYDFSQHKLQRNDSFGVFVVKLLKRNKMVMRHDAVSRLRLNSPASHFSCFKY